MPPEVRLPPRIQAALHGPLYAHGFSAVKWPILHQCFAGHTVRAWPTRGPVPLEATVLVWGAKDLPAREAVQRVIRIEDGFLRSVGLGVDLTWPVSWTVDSSGIHFDASRPSDLEQLLATGQWRAEDCARAARLRDTIVAAGLTKYNVGGADWRAPRTDRPVHLVVGQVPSDAAVTAAGAAVPYNVSLLRHVRSAHPDAYLIYKVHPDIVAGMRRNDDACADLAAVCDEVITTPDVHTLFGQVDVVHVTTSLAGFEALLRGREVHCHGRPFYAGWGLTTDHRPECGGRGRALSLDQLVHAALIDYPVYFQRGFSGLATPEEAVLRLQQARARRVDAAPIGRWVLRAALRRVVGVR